MKPTAKVLREARELIEKYGWIQHDAGSKRVGFCAAGAIERVTTNRQLRADAGAALYRATPLERYGALTKWNDDPERTKQQVINAFKRAEKALTKQLGGRI